MSKFTCSLIQLIILSFLVNFAIGVHFVDRDGLVGDVCGVVKFKGRYHLFHQFFGLHEGRVGLSMFQSVQWGHASSADLINWQIHPKIIHPFVDPIPTLFRGKEVTNVGKIVPFSGSAIVDSTNATGLITEPNDSILLVYTSLSKFLFGEYDPVTNADFIFSTVTMFYSSDGINFKKFDRPIIEHSEVFRNFRDPVVFQYAPGHYNLLLSENTKLAIYKSSDLINWNKTSVFEYELTKYIVEWETPNLIQIGNDSMLIFSFNTEPAPEEDLHYSTARYFTGKFDGYKFVANGQASEFDGPDFYAMTVNNENIMMGMINNWKYMRQSPHNGTLSYPRKVNKLQIGNSIYLTQQFHNLNSTFDQQVFDSRNIVNYQLSYQFKSNRPHYLKIRLTNLNCTKECDIELKFVDKSRNNIIRLGYSHSSNDFYLDRSESIQLNRYYNNVLQFKDKYVKLLDRNTFDIDLILDIYSVEFLTDQGTIAMSALHQNCKIFENIILTTRNKYRIDQFTVKERT